MDKFQIGEIANIIESMKSLAERNGIDSDRCADQLLIDLVDELKMLVGDPLIVRACDKVIRLFRVIKEESRTCCLPPYPCPDK